MGQDQSRVQKLPYVVVLVRLCIAPAFFYTLLSDYFEASVILYTVAFGSDLVDGMLARRLGTTASSKIEAYLDPLADFVLVMFSFAAFVLTHIYPIWILALFLLMFTLFLATSTSEEPTYDPVGKYYGIFLIGAVGVTLLFPLEIVYGGVLLIVLVYTVILLGFRTWYVYGSWKKD